MLFRLTSLVYDFYFRNTIVTVNGITADTDTRLPVESTAQLTNTDTRFVIEAASVLSDTATEFIIQEVEEVTN